MNTTSEAVSHIIYRSPLAIRLFFWTDSLGVRQCEASLQMTDVQSGASDREETMEERIRSTVVEALYWTKGDDNPSTADMTEDEKEVARTAIKDLGDALGLPRRTKEGVTND